MQNKTICDVSSYDGSNDSTNFKTAHKHATYKLTNTAFLILLSYKCVTYCKYPALLNQEATV